MEVCMIAALIPLADGVEEMEAVIILDVLRRAKWEATAAGVVSREITASRDVKLVADVLWDELDIDAYDAIVIPGGAKAAATLASDQRVLDAVRRFVAANKVVGAICAGPLVLQAAGVLEGRKATCHPGVRQNLISAKIQTGRVVEDGHIVTSQGPGTAIEFALTIVRLIDGRTTADLIAQAMVV
jgi:protein deglycase